MQDLFTWRVFDVRSLLPVDWDTTLIDIARARHTEKVLVSTHSTSREGAETQRLPTRSVGGTVLRSEAPWVISLYENAFRELAERGGNEPVSCMSDPRFACVLNVQMGNVHRYECHVDTNPIEGLLYVTSHPEGAGGELVVANNAEAASPAEVDADCSIVYPQAGHLVFFDARRASHYVRPLRDPDGLRVAVAMNYYTPSGPETARPDDLNRHLAGTD